MTNKVDDILVPQCYRVQSIIQETPDVYSIVLSHSERSQTFFPGQFNMLHMFGMGEVAIAICGNSKDSQTITHTIRATGPVTSGMEHLKPGDEIGVRGPFGSYWPLNKKGCDVLLIAGGIGLPAFRSALHFLGEHSEEYQKITLLYGTKTVDEILYKKDMELWKKQGIEIEITVDQENSLWQGHVGVVTTLIAEHLRNPDNTLVMICGPEIMMKMALKELDAAKVDQNNIFVSMERNMQCATGFCGHCLFGPFFMCKDGPVLPYAKVKKYLEIKEA